MSRLIFLVLIAGAMMTSVSVRGSTNGKVATELSLKQILIAKHVVAPIAQEQPVVMKQLILVSPAEHILMYALDQRMLPDGTTHFTGVCFGKCCKGYTSIHAPPDLRH